MVWDGSILWSFLTDWILESVRVDTFHVHRNMISLRQGLISADVFARGLFLVEHSEVIVGIGKVKCSMGTLYNAEVASWISAVSRPVSMYCCQNCCQH